MMALWLCNCCLWSTQFDVHFVLVSLENTVLHYIICMQCWVLTGSRICKPWGSHHGGCFWWSQLLHEVLQVFLCIVEWDGELFKMQYLWGSVISNAGSVMYLELGVIDEYTIIRWQTVGSLLPLYSLCLGLQLVINFFLLLAAHWLVNLTWIYFGLRLPRVSKRQVRAGGFRMDYSCQIWSYVEDTMLNWLMFPKIFLAIIVTQFLLVSDGIVVVQLLSLHGCDSLSEHLKFHFTILWNTDWWCYLPIVCILGFWLRNFTKSLPVL